VVDQTPAKPKTCKVVRLPKKKPSATWQLASWVDKALWTQWHTSLEDRRGKLTVAHLKRAQASLRRCVYDWGWPQKAVIERAIACGYPQFYPLNRPGEPVRNPAARRARGAPLTPQQRELQEALREERHWRALSQNTGSSHVQTMLRLATERLTTLQAQTNGHLETG
ncbi:MAG: hypothetical protein P8176_15450, partial [Gammaproteobacteria bacterium]